MGRAAVGQVTPDGKHTDDGRRAQRCAADVNITEATPEQRYNCMDGWMADEACGTWHVNRDIDCGCVVPE